MPHTALYRKKRPKTFKDMIGQPAVVQTLLNQLTADHISHAYLFCGTRGTGKTSVARIFSRAVNCASLNAGEPCNTCDICRDTLEERNLNVVEMDAASNTGVDYIRDLREEVKYPPTEGRYKVYIIDEAHMLSPSALNALLKTLEEPLPHVIFILATTDPQKLPATVLSRCQRYDFKRIPSDSMLDALRKYLEEEEIPFEDEALRYIVSVSDGAMRDALSIADQCYSLSNNIILSAVQELLGAVDREVIFDFADSLLSFDIPTVLKIINEAMKAGRDIGQFTSDITRHFRDLMVASQTGDVDLLNCTQETAQKLRKQSKKLSVDRIIQYLRTFSELQRDLRFAPHGRTALEVCVIELCAAEKNGDIEKQAEPKPDKRQEKKPDEPVEPDKPEASVDSLLVIVPAIPAVQQSPADTKTEIYQKIAENWDEFCWKIASPPLRSMLSSCGAETDRGRLQVITNNETNLSLLKGRKKIIEDILSEYFKLETPPNLAFILRDAYNKPVQPFVKPKHKPEIKNGITAEKTSMDEAPEVPFEGDDWEGLGWQVEMDDAW